jgi:hypothetical protein
MQLTDAEQRQLNKWEDEQRKKRGEADGPITEKVKAIAESEAVQQAERVLKELLPFVQKVEKHDDKIQEHEGKLSRVFRAFNGAVKG